MKKVLLSLFALLLGLVLGATIGYYDTNLLEQGNKAYIILGSLWIAGIIISLLFIKERGKDFKADKYLENDFRLVDIFKMLIIGWGYAFFGAIFTGSVSEFINSGQLRLPVPDFLDEFIIIELLILFVVIVAIVPIGEELCFRGIVFKEILNLSNLPMAVIVSSLFFAVVHFDPLQSVNTLIMGVLLCLCYYYSKSIISPIIVHMVNNFFAIFINISRRTYEITLIGGSICFVVGLIILGHMIYQNVSYETS